MYFKGFPRFIINKLKTRNTSIIKKQQQNKKKERKGAKIKDLNPASSA